MSLSDKITLPDLSSVDTITLDSSSIPYLSSSIIGPYPQYNVGIGTTSGSNGTFSTGGATYITNTTSPWTTLNNNGQLSVQGDAEFEGDVKIKGVSIAKALEDIQRRLSILVPDPAKLEHFEALKKAYEHYKMLEKLCELPKEEKE